ncbi:PREDICTED: DPY30 domain-containing protein 2 isoform X2 [Miniopterus natalensis]|uniref:DPY30 domain-containing protein 2 isoform X2 n=1 Tax=Miniopterus natalensis TaxID=291302 RepID=UPI0007A70723|nr:PREDICTED: DPY30 domain-containing protein 2 isoform X2 [Miniopterus natalensis]
MAEAGLELAHRMETEYLKRCLGNCLAQALAEVVKVRPSDPTEYLAHWLHHYRKVTQAKEEGQQEKTQLKEEYGNSLKEAHMTEMLKQEECHIQQEHEKCQQPLASVASSTKETIFMQENTEPHEKEVLKQECVPGASSTIPGRVPQQVPPPDPSGETDWNAEIPQEINY